MSDIRQSIKYGQYMEKIGWQTEIIDGCQFFLRPVPLFGSIIKIQRSDSIPFDQLDKLVKSSRGFLVSAEPASGELVPQLLRHGFRMNKGAMIPSKTRQIDLSLPEKEIFASFNRTRKYKIGKAIRSGFQIKIENAVNLSFPRKRESRPGSPIRSGMTDEISDFITLWTQNALKRGFWVPIKNQIKAMYKTFAEDAYLILAYQQKELIAGILLIINGKTAHYFYAASSPTGRSLCAPSLLTWEAMKLAKKKGCTIFDFEGIYDERFPQKSWKGFSYFKESFGGNVVSYPGRFIKTHGLLSRLLFL